VKAVRKGEKGVVIIAGDIFPVDVISHLPVLCEDAGIPYIYVKSKAELGAAAATKRPTSTVMIATKTKGFEGGDKLKDALSEIHSLTPTYA
jgi:H/ACA ribonucleoprotein complex subunit 2